MRRFLTYPGYRNVFACIKCEMSRNGAREYDCSKCGSLVCEHLSVDVSDGRLCFCCLDPDGESDWPDWCFTMQRGGKGGKNG